jgi:hypothetical protein
MRRARYQRGSISLIKRKDGTKAWKYRWRETQADGTSKRRATIVGSVEEYPTESDAQAAADGLRLNINDPTRRGANKDITVEALVITILNMNCRTSFIRTIRRPTSRMMNNERLFPRNTPMTAT